MPKAESDSTEPPPRSNQLSHDFSVPVSSCSPFAPLRLSVGAFEPAKLESLKVEEDAVSPL